MRVVRQNRFYRILGEGPHAEEGVVEQKGSQPQGAAEAALPGRSAPSPWGGSRVSGAGGSPNEQNGHIAVRQHLRGYRAHDEVAQRAVAV